MQTLLTAHVTCRHSLTHGTLQSGTEPHSLAHPAHNRLMPHSILHHV